VAVDRGRAVMVNLVARVIMADRATGRGMEATRSAPSWRSENAANGRDSFHGALRRR
jgi:hypothetical protein